MKNETIGVIVDANIVWKMYAVGHIKKCLLHIFGGSCNFDEIASTFQRIQSLLFYIISTVVIPFFVSEASEPNVQYVPEASRPATGYEKLATTFTTWRVLLVLLVTGNFRREKNSPCTKTVSCAKHTTWKR